MHMRSSRQSTKDLRSILTNLQPSTHMHMHMLALSCALSPWPFAAPSLLRPFSPVDKALEERGGEDRNDHGGGGSASLVRYLMFWRAKHAWAHAWAAAQGPEQGPAQGPVSNESYQPLSNQTYKTLRARQTPMRVLCLNQTY